ncbi:MAG: hypothetical protein M3245_02190, partial [Actinomycetota bacterium]|nr:hypothetical protein [Actinomycetota bacterium]
DPGFPSTPTGTGGFPAGGATDVPPLDATAVPPDVATQAAAGEGPVPTMPGYVWALLPVALLAWSMVRGVLLPATGKRAGGVVARIREHNVARRGRPLADAGGALGTFGRKAGTFVKKLKLW